MFLLESVLDRHVMQDRTVSLARTVKKLFLDRTVTKCFGLKISENVPIIDTTVGNCSCSQLSKSVPVYNCVPR